MGSRGKAGQEEVDPILLPKLTDEMLKEKILHIIERYGRPLARMEITRILREELWPYAVGEDHVAELLSELRREGKIVYINRFKGRYYFTRRTGSQLLYIKDLSAIPQEKRGVFEAGAKEIMLRYGVRRFTILWDNDVIEIHGNPSPETMYALYKAITRLQKRVVQ